MKEIISHLEVEIDGVWTPYKQTTIDIMQELHVRHPGKPCRGRTRAFNNPTTFFRWTLQDGKLVPGEDECTLDAGINVGDHSLDTLIETPEWIFLLDKKKGPLQLPVEGLYAPDMHRGLAKGKHQLFLYGFNKTVYCIVRGLPGPIINVPKMFPQAEFESSSDNIDIISKFAFEGLTAGLAIFEWKSIRP